METDQGNTQEFAQRAQEQMKGNSSIDDLINDNASLNDLVGDIPTTPNFGESYSSVKDVAKNLDEVQKKFFGTDDHEEEERVEGVINNYIRDVKTRLFGGKRKKKVKGEPGLIERGEQIYEDARNHIKTIKEGLPDINGGVRQVEAFLDKLKDQYDEHEYIFERCNEKEKKLHQLVKEAEMKSKYDDQTSDEKRKLNKVINDLTEQSEKVYRTKKHVAERIVIYDKQLQSTQNNVDSLKENYKALETRLSNMESNVEYFHSEVQSMGPLVQLTDYMNRLNKLADKMTQATGEMTDARMEQNMMLSQNMSYNPERNMIDTSKIQQHEQNLNKYKEEQKHYNTQLFDEASNIIKDRRMRK